MRKKGELSHRVAFKCESCGIEKQHDLSKYSKAIHHFCSNHCKAVYKWKDRDVKESKERRTLSRRKSHYKNWGNLGNPEDIFYYGYKEPLRTVEDGYGFFGVLAANKKTGFVQCHICGLFFKSLNPRHLMIHELTTREYKSKFGFDNSTALMTEATRIKHIKAYEHHWGEKTPEEIERRKENILKAKQIQLIQLKTATHRKRKRGLDKYNKLGKCPDQLLDKIKRLSDRLGRVPKHGEFVREYGYGILGSIQYTFGGYKNAVNKLGLKTYKEDLREKYSEFKLLSYLTDFYKVHRRVPMSSDANRGLIPSLNYYKKLGGLTKARRLAGLPDPEYASYGMGRTRIRIN